MRATTGPAGPNRATSGLLVVFEGIDGSGKTTVSNRVAEALRTRGLRVTHVRSGGQLASPVAENIRQLARDQRNLALAPFVEFLLYVARETQQLEECILPALAEADVVIADRFLQTAAVMAGPGRGLPAERTAPVLRAAAGHVGPDLTILIDVDPQVARARRRADKLARPTVRTSSRKGLSGAGLMQRLRDGYLRVAAEDGQRWLIVDNTSADLDALVVDLVSVIDGLRRGDAAPAIPAPVAAIGSAGRPRPPTPRDPEEARDAFLGWVDVETAREPEVAAHMLGGLAGDGVDDRRRALATVAPAVIAGGLRGLVDPVSHVLRDRLRRQHPDAVARSLTGIDEADEPTWTFRAELAAIAPNAVAASLDGYRGARAWRLRERLWPQAPASVVESLLGDDGDEAWRLRDEWLLAMGGPDALDRLDVARSLCHSLRGLGGDPAWTLRERAWSGSPVGALLSLTGLDDDRAWAWRRRHVERAPVPVLRSIAGLDQPAAWELRERMHLTCKEVLDSVVGLDTEPAWELRERLADRWPSTVAKSLGELGFTTRGRDLVGELLARYPGNLSLLKHAAAIARPPALPAAQAAVR
jgi:dTMP kinase